MNCTTAPSHSRQSSTSSVYTDILGEDSFLSGVLLSKPPANKFFDTSVIVDGFGDDEPSFRTNFSWRQDPEESFSDWTIEVTGRCLDDSTKHSIHTYHVHKCKLGAGPRRSKYFQSLFFTACHLSEHQEQTSRIEFLETEVSSFESMLDFMYGIETPTMVNTSNAVVLRYLAFYFQCGALMMQLNTFLGDDLVPANGPHYLAEASKYHDQRLQLSAANVCSANIERLSTSALNALPMELFQKIIRSSEIKCASAPLSIVVASYLEHHHDKVTAAVLVLMTRDLHKFDEAASKVIMDMVRKLNPQDDLASWELLESVIVRCALATNWRTIDPKAMRNSFKHDWNTDSEYHQATSFASIQAAAALKSAQRDFKTELSALKEENSELQLEKNELVAELSCLADEVDRLRRNLDWFPLDETSKSIFGNADAAGRTRRYLTNRRSGI